MDPVSAFKYENDHGVKLKGANMDYSCKNITKFIILFIYNIHTRKFDLITIVYSNRRAYFFFRR